MIYNQNGDIVSNTVCDISNIENICENLLINLNEMSFQEAINNIRDMKNKFFKIVKEAVDNLIDKLINNVFSKNAKIKNNKDNIINSSLNNDIKFNGYIFNLYGDNGAVNKLKTALQLNVYQTIELYAYDNKPDFMNVFRSLLVNDNNNFCREEEFINKVKDFIYGSNSPSEYTISDLQEPIESIVDRICDSNKTIRNLKSLYTDMKKYIDSENNSRSKFYSLSNDMNDAIKREILASEAYIKVCHEYLNILIPAIREEYKQSYLICLRLLNIK